MNIKRSIKSINQFSDDINECKIKLENVVKCISACSSKSIEIIEALEGDIWTSKSKNCKRGKCKS